jgi:hydrogenase nickel incorporation protein HypA/HybF
VHELAVVRSIVETVAAHAGGGAVARVRLVIGSQSGVSPEALEFCFGLATRDTVLDGADLTVDVRPGRQLMIDSIEVV